MPRRTSGLAESFGPGREEQMPASNFGTEDHDWAIRVVPEADGVVAVCAEGDFDLTNASALDDKIQSALDAGDGLILDLSKATFIDSSIINVVVDAAQTAGSRKQTVVLQFGTAAVVERVLELVKIEEVLPRAHDREEALRMTQPQAASVCGIGAARASDAG